MQPYLYPLRVLALTGYTLSVLCLGIALLLLLYFSKLRRDDKNKMHVHLFLSFLCRAVACLVTHTLLVDNIGFHWDIYYVDKQVHFCTRAAVRQAVILYLHAYLSTKNTYTSDVLSW